MIKVLTGSFKKPDLKVFANICLKINFKLGGRNHTLRDGLGLRQDTLVVGADVTHPGRCPDPGCPSLAGLVACDASHSSDYLASARLQDPNTEYIGEVGQMMVEQLKNYSAKHGRLPANILFYRDGVGESQYGMVKREELPRIIKACEDMRDEKTKMKLARPKITIVVVEKRHHARFFPTKREAQGNNLDPNLPPGTCVDTDVVAPNRFEFYLQSHDSPRGTAKNGHYVVITNESDCTMEACGHQTHNLCFTGSRATTALSTCTPVRYADILCTRLRCYMRPVLRGEMTDKLKNDEVTTYRSLKIIWGSEKVNKIMGNPWKKELNDTMFYL
ncbi:Piwi domain-containing protein [Amylocarpus encephaloides]|uniref:Piwi domain-containing protein n=1 Tax=Amylocarpus encephaloides TaxID=45428 RepID=A0A9P7YHS7_9HELO|nr:Piwi domain-containing protein [Amylocarpus encephaloides]